MYSVNCFITANEWKGEMYGLIHKEEFVLKISHKIHKPIIFTFLPSTKIMCSMYQMDRLFQFWGQMNIFTDTVAGWINVRGPILSKGKRTFRQLEKMLHIPLATTLLRHKLKLGYKLQSFGLEIKPRTFVTTGGQRCIYCRIINATYINIKRFPLFVATCSWFALWYRWFGARLQ